MQQLRTIRKVQASRRSGSARPHAFQIFVHASWQASAACVEPTMAAAKRTVSPDRRR
jgi:hypothetical protein